MNTLPTWAQVTIVILGAGYIPNIIAIVSLIINTRQKNQELKDARMQRLNDNILQNTRSQIDTLYIPINALLAKIETKYDEYQSANMRCDIHELRRSKEERKPETEASVELARLIYGNRYETILSLKAAFQELIDYQEKMIAEGTNAYLTKEFERRLYNFVEFLHGISNHFEDTPGAQPKESVLETSEFEEDLYKELNFLRSYIRGLALGTHDPIKSTSKKNS